MLSWLPENVSTFGGQIDTLFYVIYYLTTAVFFAVQITLLVFLFRYRDRPGRKATYTHGNTTLEIVWTAIPAVILAVLALVSRSTWAEIKETQPPSDFMIQVERLTSASTARITAGIAVQMISSVVLPCV